MKKPKLIEVLEEFEKGPAILFHNRPQYGRGPDTMMVGGKRLRVVNVWPAISKKLAPSECEKTDAELVYGEIQPLVIVHDTLSTKNKKGAVTCIANSFKLSDAGRKVLEDYRTEVK